jgi:hypothetical protein
MHEQIFVKKSEAVGHPSAVSDDFVQTVTKRLVKDGAPQFQNYHENSHKYHIAFSTRLSQLG